MSDIMYDDIKIDWRTYAVHNDQFIKGLFGDYFYLSNAKKCEVCFEGVIYPSSENAYQASKIIPKEREHFLHLSAYDSKKYWRNYTSMYTAEEWDAIKYKNMYQVLYDKFSRNTDLGQLLKETKSKYIEETNHWQDTYYGVCYQTKIGENNLGKILMDIRSRL
jgi:ribA/ribD-fused uncharacterized protein